MNELRIRELGLAAYIKIHSTKLIRFDRAAREFVFMSDKDEDEWRAKYLDSEAYRHDNEVMSMRKFLIK